MPSLYDLALQLPALPGVNAIGAPDLRPVAIWNLDLGYDRALPSISSVLTVDGFLQRNTDLISASGNGPVTFGPGAANLVAANIGTSKEAGVELGLKGKFTDGLRFNASYRFVAIGQDVIGGLPANSDTVRSNGTPRNVVIVGVGYTLRPWEFDLNARWQSAFTDYLALPYKTYDVGNYVTFAGRIGYNVTKHLTLSVSGQQFNLARIRESSGLLVDRRVIAGVTVHY